jgi:hypothetical protein
MPAEKQPKPAPREPSLEPPVIDLRAYGPTHEEVLQALGLREGKDAHGPAKLQRD